MGLCLKHRRLFSLCHHGSRINHMARYLSSCRQLESCYRPQAQEKAGHTRCSSDKPAQNLTNQSIWSQNYNYSLVQLDSYLFKEDNLMNLSYWMTTPWKNNFCWLQSSIILMGHCGQQWFIKCFLKMAPSDFKSQVIAITLRQTHTHLSKHIQNVIGWNAIRKERSAINVTWGGNTRLH